MTTHQTSRGTDAPIAATLNTPPWARAEPPQGRSQAESSRTADRAAHTHADDTTQVSAVSVPPPSGRAPMAREPHSPASPHPDPPGPQNTPGSAPPARPALLSQRTALILFISAVVGVGVGVLTFLAKDSYPEAVLAGLFAAGACTGGLHNLIA